MMSRTLCMFQLISFWLFTKNLYICECKKYDYWFSELEICQRWILQYIVSSLFIKFKLLYIFPLHICVFLFIDKFPIGDVKLKLIEETSSFVSSRSLCDWLLTYLTLQGRWNVSSGDNIMVGGKGHSNQVQDMAITSDTLVSIGMDDMIMYSKLATIEQSG